MEDINIHGAGRSADQTPDHIAAVLTSLDATLLQRAKSRSDNMRFTHEEKDKVLKFPTWNEAGQHLPPSSGLRKPLMTKARKKQIAENEDRKRRLGAWAGTRDELATAMRKLNIGDAELWGDRVMKSLIEIVNIDSRSLTGAGRGRANQATLRLEDICWWVERVVNAKSGVVRVETAVDDLCTFINETKQGCKDSLQKYEQEAIDTGFRPWSGQLVEGLITKVDMMKDIGGSEDVEKWDITIIKEVARGIHKKRRLVYDVDKDEDEELEDEEANKDDEQHRLKRQKLNGDGGTNRAAPIPNRTERNTVQHGIPTNESTSTAETKDTTSQDDDIENRPPTYKSNHADSKNVAVKKLKQTSLKFGPLNSGIIEVIDLTED